MEPDRLHPAVGAGAADVDGMLAGEGSELVGGRQGLGPNRFGLLPCAAGDDPRLHGRAEPVFEGFLEFLGRWLDGAGKSWTGAPEEEPIGLATACRADALGDAIGDLLAHEEKWEEIVSFVPQSSGEGQKVDFWLYIGDEAKPYFDDPLNLNIDVTESP